MSTERLSMRKTKEILRLKWVLKHKHRTIGLTLGISAGSVGGVVARACAAGLTWETVEPMSEEALEARLHVARPTAHAARPLPDPAYLHAERHKTGVTLNLLHQEYLQQHPDGYGYTQFCEHYREWLGRKRLSMRQVHLAGEKTFVDYSGKKPSVVDPSTGEVREVELFVAVLGASNFTFAEATETQRGIDFIGSHVHAFAHFGGVTRALVPDQLKSAVTQACRYDPGIQRTYEEMARHYGAVVMPARPGHPRDKAKVEGAVLLVQRWILARLRNETFFSLNALNERISDLLDDLNDRTMRLYGKSRRELFEELEKPVLMALPVEPFVYAEWKVVRMNIDYHVEVDHHYYSASHTLARQQLESRSTATTVELFHKGERVASHLRSSQRGRHTTVSEHMPKAHQKHLEWTPSRIVHWAGTIGVQTKLLVERILSERPHPEMGYRTCLGILRLGKRYGNERLEAASARAVRVRALSYRSVDSILKNGLDRLPAPEAEPVAGNPVVHENVRGGGYYH